MALSISHFLLQLILVVLGLVISHADGSILSNKTQQDRISPSLEMTTLIRTGPSVVRHMEPDMRIPGNILFSNGNALGTANGVTSTEIRASLKSVYGFHQMSETHVIAVDFEDHCLRFVNRATLAAPPYAGYCGRSGYSQGTTQARFNQPRGVYVDRKRAGMIFVTEYNAIRHVQTMPSSFNPRVPSVSEFFKSSIIDIPRGLAQDPLTGDLYITADHHNVFKLSYASKTLSRLDGFSGGFADRPYGPAGIILIDNGRKLVLANSGDHRLLTIDLLTGKASAFCTSVQGHTDGDLTSCTLFYPLSLMMLNDTLYIGEIYNIRKISGYGGMHYCLTGRYEVSTVTGLALVEIPGPGGQVKLSLPPGKHAIQMEYSGYNCTVEYLISDTIPGRLLACPHTEIQMTASSDTGVADVELPLSGSRTGTLSLPPGKYPLHIASDTFNCTVDYEIKDNRPRRRLVFEAQYKIGCETTTGNITKAVTSIAQHIFRYADICDSDCDHAQDTDIEVTCLNQTLTVVWPSNLTYTADVNRIPDALGQRLTARIIAKGSGYYLFLPEISPPIVFPEENANGGYMITRLASYCVGENVSYLKATDSCE